MEYNDKGNKKLPTSKLQKYGSEEKSVLNKNKQIKQFPEWKVKNKEYKKELQAFLDKADNIENEDLKNDIICQMLKCDKILTKIAVEKIDEISIKKS